MRHPTPAQLVVRWAFRAQRGTELQTTGVFHAPLPKPDPVREERESGLWATLAGWQSQSQSQSQFQGQN